MNWDALAAVLAAPVSLHRQDVKGFYVDAPGLVRDRQCVDLIRLAFGLDLLYTPEGPITSR